ncbi:MAG: hypothetical protein CMF74_06790 [Maricaulis sp.]|nr:hypothetical protein [Maricaulis sp.]|tara:strand:+ start:144 stop:962 length:819 start_codon:yes stop_codon:yes gene_type:complete
MKTLRVLSLGAGVQSTTLALMIEKGEIPMVDAAIFSDTGAEPKAVYDHLDWLETQLSYPIHRTQWRSLKKDIIYAALGENDSFSAPFFTLNSKTGKKGMLMRQCTRDYKILPLYRKLKRLMGYRWRQHVNKKKWHAEVLIGISSDEMQRVKENKLPYASNVYPLIEKDISRAQCLEWMKKNNYPEPPRSACTFCPYHSNKEWLDLKKNKDEWDEIVKIDELIRYADMQKENKITGQLFLHQSCTPISQAKLVNKKNDLQFSFDDECEGMCGN